MTLKLCTIFNMECVISSIATTQKRVVLKLFIIKLFVLFLILKKKIVKGLTSGSKYGLHLEMYVGKTDRHFTHSSGLKAFVHDSKIDPDFSKDGILVPIGFETDVVISQTNYKRIGDCIKNATNFDDMTSDLARRNFRFYETYSRKYCLLCCLNIYINEMCDCNISVYRIEDTSRYSLDDLKCIDNYSAQFYANDTLTLDCFEKCPPQCESASYSMSSSQATYPSKFYENLIQIFFDHWNGKKPHEYNFTKLDNMKDSSLAVNFFLMDKGHNLITEFPIKTFGQLLTDIGGLLGLWIGGSLLTLFEMVDLLISIICFFLTGMSKIKMTESDIEKIGNISEIDFLKAELKKSEEKYLRQSQKIDKLEKKFDEMFLKNAYCYE